MATATSQAPTEAEIRAAVIARIDPSDIDVGPWVHELGAPIAYRAPTEHDAGSPDCLWVNLRPSEATRLSDLLEAVYSQANVWEAELIGKIVEAAVEAGLTFAAEYPDAPRPTRQAVPA